MEAFPPEVALCYVLVLMHKFKQFKQDLLMSLEFKGGPLLTSNVPYNDGFVITAGEEQTPVLVPGQAAHAP